MVFVPIQLCSVSSLNRLGMHSIDVRDLNWLSDFHQLTEGEEPFSWTRQEVECLNQVEIFLAADGKNCLLYRHSV